MDYKRAKNYLALRGQSHLLEYYDELTEEQRVQLLNDIQNANFSVLRNINKPYNLVRKKIKPANVVSLADVARRRHEYESVGMRMLEQNKVGAVLLAGGMGTRLGFDKPKGMFNVGETRFVSIFELLMQNINDVVEVTGRHFPLFIMTSFQNDAETRKFFEDNNYFGYPHDKVHFFMQNVEPTCDFNGKVYLAEKWRISFSPNGNGGWYSSLINAGYNRILDSEGVEWLNVFGVDNVLQRICDPAFIGATVMSGSRCGAKVVCKTDPTERVGLLCQSGGKPHIVEYFEMPEKLQNKRERDGQLTFRYGITLNYLFNVYDLNATLAGKLPYHIAKKAIPHIENGKKVSPEDLCGYKFETLVVDMVKLMGTCLGFEVERENEFAPIKNKTGKDSVETARMLLKKNGVKL